MRGAQYQGRRLLREFQVSTYQVGTPAKGSESADSTCGGTLKLKPENLNPIWGFPKIGGYLLGGPHNKDNSILGSGLGCPCFGNYQIVNPEPQALPSVELEAKPAA